MQKDLSRIGDWKLDRYRGPSAMRTQVLPLGRLDTVVKVWEAVKQALSGLDGCEVFLSERRWSMDAAFWKQSWTRAARRDKARRAAEGSDKATHARPWTSEGLQLGARISVTKDRALNVTWTYGESKGTFESMASHVIRKVEDANKHNHASPESTVTL